MTYRFEVYHQTSSFVWLSIALKGASLINSMRVTKKKSLHISNGTDFLNLMPLAGKMNPVDFLDLMHIAAIGLNYLIDHLLG